MTSYTNQNEATPKWKLWQSKTGKCRHSLGKTGEHTMLLMREGPAWSHTTAKVKMNDTGLDGRSPQGAPP